jgi:SAM-dependent methyltransferase
VERLEIERVIHLCLADGDYRDILDLGTGSGLFAEEFSKLGLEIAGLDVNFEILLAARGYVPEGKFIQALVEALPFAKGSFDLVFCGLVLHEADDPLSMLMNARRVIRKKLCVLEWPYREQTFGPSLSDRLNPARLEELFNEAGFTRWECNRLNNVDLYRLEIEGDMNKNQIKGG